MTPCTIANRIQYSVDNARPHMPEMQKLIRAWNKLKDSDRAKIEYTMKPVLDLPGVGGLVALELAAKLGIFLIEKGVSEL